MPIAYIEKMGTRYFVHSTQSNTSFVRCTAYAAHFLVFRMVRFSHPVF